MNELKVPMVFVRDNAGRVWIDYKAAPSVLIGKFDEVAEAMAAFLAQQDFGETLK